MKAKRCSTLALFNGGPLWLDTRARYALGKMHEKEGKTWLELIQ